MQTPKTIGVRVLKSEQVRWRDLQFIQQDNFKGFSEEARQRLKTSLVDNKFVQPFYVWQDNQGANFCLDGKHRTLILEELITDGYQIPKMLPAIFVECADKKEAAELVLVFSSMYAKVSETGLYDFLKLHDIHWPDLEAFVSIPGIEEFKLDGDLGRDFSIRNQELDIEEFTDEIILKFKYPKSEYLAIKEKINGLQERLQLSSPEQVLKHLLN